MRLWVCRELEQRKEKEKKFTKGAFGLRPVGPWFGFRSSKEKEKKYWTWSGCVIMRSVGPIYVWGPHRGF